jgi:galactokinase
MRILISQLLGPINLVESKVVPEFQTKVAREYEKRTALFPQIFVSQLAGGASELPL